MKNYNKRCRGDIREEMDRNSSAYEDSCSQAGKALAAPPTGGMGTSIVANHYTSLLKLPKTFLEVAAETLSGE